MFLYKIIFMFLYKNFNIIIQHIIKHINLLKLKNKKINTNTITLLLKIMKMISEILIVKVLYNIEIGLTQIKKEYDFVF